MKLSLILIMMMLFLLPSASFGFHWRPDSRDRHRYDRPPDRSRYDDWRDRYRQEREARYAFDREHPRYPRYYCHKHQYPLHADDKRRHCHNWDTEDAYSSYGRSGYSSYDRPVWWPWR